MATQKQIDANRLNSQKSTGPRTDEGKAKSRLNSFKHGLTGQLDIMTDEQREAHDAFVSRIVLSLKPADAVENQLAHSIAESYWRMNRVAVIEDTLLAEGNYVEFAHNLDKAFSDLERALSSVRGFIEHPERFSLLTVYEMRLHRKAQSELKQLREIQQERRNQEAGRRQDAANRNAQPAPKPAPAPQPVPPLVMQSAESAGVSSANGFDFSPAEFAESRHAKPRDANARATLS